MSARMPCLQRSRDSFRQSVPSFYHVIPGDQLRLGNKGLDPPNHLTNPEDILVCVNMFTASFSITGHLVLLSQDLSLNLGARLAGSKLQ